MKTQVVLYVVLSAFAALTARAQSYSFGWVNQYANTTAGAQVATTSTALDSYGNVYATGYYNANVDFDPGPGVAMLTTPPSGVICTFITKTDPSGNLIWAKSFQPSGTLYTVSTNGLMLATDASDDVIVTGFLIGTADFDPGPGVYLKSAPGVTRYIYICKLNSAGDFQYVSLLEGPGDNRLNGMTTDAAGNVYLAGNYNAGIDMDPGPGTYNLFYSPGYYEGFILKLNSSGNFVWAARLGASVYNIDNNLVVTRIILTPGGNVLCGGIFRGNNLDFNPGAGTALMTSASLSIFLLKLTPSGSFIWAKKVDGSGTSSLYGLGNDAAGNIFTSGNFSGTVDFAPGAASFPLTASGTDAFVSKLDSSGNHLWTFPLGASGTDQCLSLAVDTSSHIWVTGMFNNTVDFDPGPVTTSLTAPATNSTFLCRYSPTGALKWLGAFKYDNATGYDHTIAPSGTSALYAAGRFMIPTDFDPGPGTHTLTTSTGFWDGSLLKLSHCDLSGGSIIASACDAYTSPTGSTYTATGVYTDTLHHMYSCDSLFTLNLTVNSSSASSITASACGSYTLNSVTYTTSGVYTQSLTNAAGCDSTLTLNLSVGTSTSASLTISACDTYTLNGFTYTSSGVYTQSLTNAAGCDSTLTLNLSVGTSTSASLTASACDTYTLNGFTYTTSGVYTQSLTNAAGCDSALTLNLTIRSSTTANLTISACDTYTLNGFTYTTSGVYTQSLINAAGCDSTLTLNLSVGTSTTASLTASACDTYTLNGFTYTSSGVYLQSLINAAGCDSTLTLNLTIRSSTTASLTVSACETYTLNGFSYTTSGMYVQSFTNAAGCDSSLTLNLSIIIVDTSVSAADPVLTSNAAGASYRWMICDSSGLVFTGDTNQVFTAAFNGDFAVIVSSGGCVDTSACYPILMAYSDRSSIDKGFMLYPNPTDGTAFLSCNHAHGDLLIQLFDAAGKKVSPGLQLHSGYRGDFPLTTPLSAGVYWVKITGTYFVPVVMKLVKL